MGAIAYEIDCFGTGRPPEGSEIQSGTPPKLRVREYLRLSLPLAEAMAPDGRVAMLS